MRMGGERFQDEMASGAQRPSPSLPTQIVSESESESHSVVSSCLWPHVLYTVHRILQARILEWVAMPSSRGSSWPRDQTQVSRIAGRFLTIWATREAHHPEIIMLKFSHLSIKYSKTVVLFFSPVVLFLSSLPRANQFLEHAAYASSG